MNLTQISKFLSLVLRHEPQKIGIELDANGWVDCDTLITAANAKGIFIDYTTLLEVVETNDKQRFSLNEDGTRVRANQGHSVNIDLQLSPRTPPVLLYHGTVGKFIESIRTQGIQKRQRHQVHLSHELQTAIKVGQRRGQPIILTIHAAKMQQAGHVFFCSTNGVWLTDHIPPEFIDFP